MFQRELDALRNVPPDLDGQLRTSLDRWEGGDAARTSCHRGRVQFLCQGLGCGRLVLVWCLVSALCVKRAPFHTLVH